MPHGIGQLTRERFPPLPGANGPPRETVTSPLGGVRGGGALRLNDSRPAPGEIRDGIRRMGRVLRLRNAVLLPPHRLAPGDRDVRRRLTNPQPLKLE